MIHGKKALLALVLGLLLILGGCAGNQGTFTGRVEQISDWSLVAREPEEGKAYTFWARETKLDFLGLGDMVRITYRGKLEENKPLSIVSVENTGDQRGKHHEIGNHSMHADRRLLSGYGGLSSGPASYGGFCPGGRGDRNRGLHQLRRLPG